MDDFVSKNITVSIKKCHPVHILENNYLIQYYKICVRFQEYYSKYKKQTLTDRLMERQTNGQTDSQSDILTVDMQADRQTHIHIGSKARQADMQMSIDTKTGRQIDRQADIHTVR